MIFQYRIPWLRLVCICKERCADRNQFLCSDGINQRKKCKYCRFEKCQALAGMERKWVISGHIPTVQNCIKSKSRYHNDRSDVETTSRS